MRPLIRHAIAAYHILRRAVVVTNAIFTSGLNLIEDGLMAQFKYGEKVNLELDGTEIEVKIVGSGNGLLRVEGMSKGKRVQYAVPPEDLLPLKGPFFDARGLVFTTSVNHPGEQGEIIKRGKGSDGARFFCVQFSDGSTEWLKEHEVCIEEEPSPKLVADLYTYLHLH
jgi:hypothetical protein